MSSMELYHQLSIGFFQGDPSYDNVEETSAKINNLKLVVHIAYNVGKQGLHPAGNMSN